jgi:hypothetical protein
MPSARATRTATSGWPNCWPQAWGPATPTHARAQAQAWLRQQGYQPHRFEVGWLMPLARLVPLLHHDDHPAGPARGRFDVSMPASLEAFVQPAGACHATAWSCATTTATSSCAGAG